MNFSGLSAGSIAGSVWTNATRSLTADPATDAGAATLNWTHAARSLTTLANTKTVVNARGSSIANNAILDLRPAAGNYRSVYITHVNNPANGDEIGFYDGTNFDGSSTAMAAWGVFGIGTPTSGMSYKNTTGAASSVSYSGWDEA